MAEIKLKLKYRVRPFSKGGRSSGRVGGQFSSDPYNTRKKYSKRKEEGDGHRRRQGLGYTDKSGWGNKA